jgi:hypothetical protein
MASFAVPNQLDPYLYNGQTISSFSGVSNANLTVVPPAGTYPANLGQSIFAGNYTVLRDGMCVYDVSNNNSVVGFLVNSADYRYILYNSTFVSYVNKTLKTNLDVSIYNTSNGFKILTIMGLPCGILEQVYSFSSPFYASPTKTNGINYDVYTSHYQLEPLLTTTTLSGIPTTSDSVTPIGYPLVILGNVTATPYVKVTSQSGVDAYYSVLTNMASYASPSSLNVIQQYTYGNYYNDTNNNIVDMLTDVLSSNFTSSGNNVVPKLYTKVKVGTLSTNTTYTQAISTTDPSKVWYNNADNTKVTGSPYINSLYPTKLMSAGGVCIGTITSVYNNMFYPVYDIISSTYKVYDVLTRTAMTNLTITLSSNNTIPAIGDAVMLQMSNSMVQVGWIVNADSYLFYVEPDTNINGVINYNVFSVSTNILETSLVVKSDIEGTLVADDVSNIYVGKVVNLSIYGKGPPVSIQMLSVDNISNIVNINNQPALDYKYDTTSKLIKYIFSGQEYSYQLVTNGSGTYEIDMNGNVLVKQNSVFTINLDYVYEDNTGNVYYNGREEPTIFLFPGLGPDSKQPNYTHLYQTIARSNVAAALQPTNTILTSDTVFAPKPFDDVFTSKYRSLLLLQEFKPTRLRYIDDISFSHGCNLFKYLKSMEDTTDILHEILACVVAETFIDRVEEGGRLINGILQSKSVQQATRDMFKQLITEPVSQMSNSTLVPINVPILGIAGTDKLYVINISSKKLFNYDYTANNKWETNGQLSNTEIKALPTYNNSSKSLSLTVVIASQRPSLLWKNKVIIVNFDQNGNITIIRESQSHQNLPDDLLTSIFSNV